MIVPELNFSHIDQCYDNSAFVESRYGFFLMDADILKNRVADGQLKPISLILCYLI